jgi:hypothetical protein
LIVLFPFSSSLSSGHSLPKQHTTDRTARKTQVTFNSKPIRTRTLVTSLGKVSALGFEHYRYAERQPITGLLPQLPPRHTGTEEGFRGEQLGVDDQIPTEFA